MCLKFFKALFYAGFEGVKIPNTFNTVKTVKRTCPPKSFLVEWKHDEEIRRLLESLP